MPENCDTTTAVPGILVPPSLHDKMCKVYSPVDYGNTGFGQLKICKLIIYYAHKYLCKEMKFSVFVKMFLCHSYNNESKYIEV